MAYTQDDLDRIDDAIAKGVRRVTYKDRTIEYASIDDLRKARDHIASKLSKRKRRAYGVYVRSGA